MRLAERLYELADKYYYDADEPMRVRFFCGGAPDRVLLVKGTICELIGMFLDEPLEMTKAILVGVVGPQTKSGYRYLYNRLEKYYQRK